MKYLVTEIDKDMKETHIIYYSTRKLLIYISCFLKTEDKTKLNKFYVEEVKDVVLDITE